MGGKSIIFCVLYSAIAISQLIRLAEIASDGTERLSIEWEQVTCLLVTTELAVKAAFLQTLKKYSSYKGNSMLPTSVD